MPRQRCGSDNNSAIAMSNSVNIHIFDAKHVSRPARCRRADRFRLPARPKGRVTFCHHSLADLHSFLRCHRLHDTLRFPQLCWVDETFQFPKSHRAEGPFWFPKSRRVEGTFRSPEFHRAEGSFQFPKSHRAEGAVGFLANLPQTGFEQLQLGTHCWSCRSWLRRPGDLRPPDFGNDCRTQPLGREYQRALT